MLSFIPKFNQAELKDSELAAMKHQDDFEAEMDEARGEFIFLLDRSGSMDWGNNRMGMAKEALILFIKSLPNK